MFGHADTCKLLLDSGAGYDAYDHAGHHMLNSTVIKDSFDVVKVLPRLHESGQK